MNKTRIRQLWGLSMLACTSSFGVAAQSGGVFEITRSTIEAGGASSSGGIFEVTGSIGQFEVNGTTDTALYEVTGGFWVSSNDLIFENGFEQE